MWWLNVQINFKSSVLIVHLRCLKNSKTACWSSCNLYNRSYQCGIVYYHSSVCDAGAMNWTISGQPLELGILLDCRHTTQISSSWSFNLLRRGTLNIYLQVRYFYYIYNYYSDYLRLRLDKMTIFDFCDRYL